MQTHEGPIRSKLNRSNRDRRRQILQRLFARGDDRPLEIPDFACQTTTKTFDVRFIQTRSQYKRKEYPVD